MATVYLARDLKHEREVALKVLKPELAAVVGADRFLTEIRTTANLQHPHILPLFDSGEADSFLFYVMPYVEGESLRERLQREKQLPVDEALRIATDVAEALHAAHERGVIHRDIKPANILMSRGRPLVADFGIALAVSSAGAGRLTETGLSMGTPWYMSPEQASADRDPTPASDIYSLACVLYEMLVGEPPYSGGTAQAVLAKILTAAPPTAATARRSIPPHVDAVLRKALERLPADRFPDARSFARALADPSFRYGEGDAPPTPALFWTRKRVMGAALALAAVLVAGLVAGRATAPSAPVGAGEVVVTELLPPEGEEFSDRRSFGALSPDGRAFAFVSIAETGERRLWIRSFDRLEAELLPGTSGAESPFWSPDGTALAFFAGGRLMRFDLETSTPRALCAASGATDGAWGPGDVIVFAGPRGIERAEADGCRVVIPLDPEAAYYRAPSLLDDGTLLFQRRTAGVTDNGAFGNAIVRADLDGGDRGELIPGLSPTFVPPNHVVYGQLAPEGFTLFGQALSPDRSRVEGEPVPLSGPVRDTDLQLSYSASASGALVYLPTLGNREKLLVDRRGEFVDTVRQRRTWTYRVAREHPWVAMAESYDLWLYDLERGVSTPLVQDVGPEGAWDPVWSPGDTMLALGNCTVVRVDDPARATTIPVAGCRKATDWSPDGRFLIVEAAADLDEPPSLVAYDLENEEAIPLFSVTGATSQAVVSPDGTQIAYSSSDTGSPEVYVRPFLAPGRAVRLTTGGARSPRWRADGRELFFQTADGRIMSFAVPVDGDLSGAEPRLLFQAEGYARAMLYDRGTIFDVTPDGERFVLRLRETRARSVLIQNWPATMAGGD